MDPRCQCPLRLHCSPPSRIHSPISSPAALNASTHDGHPAWTLWLVMPVRVFLSFRIREALREANLLKKALEALEAKNITVFLSDVEPGEDLMEEIAKAADECSLAVLLATHTYGKKTNNQFDTARELGFFLQQRKPIFFIKMCEDFEDPATQFQLGTNRMWEQWMPGTEMPPGIVDKIVSKLERVERGTPTPPAVTPSPDGSATVGSTGGLVPAPALSGETLPNTDAIEGWKQDDIEDGLTRVLRMALEARRLESDGTSGESRRTMGHALPASASAALEPVWWTKKTLEAELERLREDNKRLELELVYKDSDTSSSTHGEDGNGSSDAQRDAHQLERIKARTMYRMVEDLDRNSVQRRKFLFLTNFQADQIASNGSSVQKMLDALELGFGSERAPKLVINLIHSAGFREYTNAYGPSGYCNAKYPDMHGVLAGQPAFRTAREEQTAKTAIDTFVGEVLLPLAAKQNAIILCSAHSCTCALTASLSRMFAAQRGKWGNDIPFHILAMSAQVSDMYHNNDKDSEWRRVREQSHAWKRANEDLGMAALGKKHATDPQPPKEFCRAVSLDGGKRTEYVKWDKHDREWPQIPPNDHSARGFDLDREMMTYIVVDTFDKKSKKLCDRGPFERLSAEMVRQLTSTLPTIAIKTGFSPRERESQLGTFGGSLGTAIKSLHAGSPLLFLDVRVRDERSVLNSHEGSKAAAAVATKATEATRATATAAAAEAKAANDTSTATETAEVDAGTRKAEAAVDEERRLCESYALHFPHWQHESELTPVQRQLLYALQTYDKHRRLLLQDSHKVWKETEAGRDAADKAKEIYPADGEAASSVASTPTHGGISPSKFALRTPMEAGSEEEEDDDTRPFPVAEVYDAMTIAYFNQIVKPPTTTTMRVKQADRDTGKEGRRECGPLMLWEARAEAEAHEQGGGGDAAIGRNGGVSQKDIQVRRRAWRARTILIRTHTQC